MNSNKTIKLIIIFLLGFLSANLIGLYYVYGTKIPFSFNIKGASLAKYATLGVIW